MKASAAQLKRKHLYINVPSAINVSAAISRLPTSVLVAWQQVGKQHGWNL